MSDMAEASSPQTLIYIAGYGRSGSTLLGRILTLNPEVVDLGEVMTVTRYLDRPHYRCSCGSKPLECPVWGPALRQVDPKHARFAGREEHLALLEEIARTAPAKYLVDSSKTAGSHANLPFHLSRQLSFPTELVHLVRDPRAVLWSVFRRTGKKTAPKNPVSRFFLAMKIALSWTYANFAAEMFRISAPDRYTRVVYDRILQEGLPGWLHTVVPQARLEGVSLSAGPANSHAIGGNFMRKNRQVEIAADEEWREKLSVPLSLVVTVICLPLMLRYRLLWSGGPDPASHPADG